MDFRTRKNSVSKTRRYGPIGKRNDELQFCTCNLSVAVLLDWGYSVSIESGHLIINPNNNMPCVKHLTNSHKLKLMVEILQKIGRDALTFHSHSASKYGPTLAGGVTLQFTHVLTGSEAVSYTHLTLPTICSV